VARLEITESFLEVTGSGSIVGALFIKYGKIPEEVELVFFETTSYWKSKHGGPKMFVVPEFSIWCLVEDIIALARKCKLTVVVEERNPPDKEEP